MGKEIAMNKRNFIILMAVVFVVSTAIIVIYQHSSQKNHDHLRRQRSQDAPLQASSHDIVAVNIDKGVQTTANLINGQFSLIDHNGKKRTHRDFLGRYTLVYFGYTFCPDICPQALTNLSQALYALKNKAHNINVLFITFDPERDTPPELARYLENFHPQIIALTGNTDAVEKAAQGFRVYYAKSQSSSDSDYLLDHTSIIYVMNKRGRYVTSFNHETSPKDIIAIMQPYLNE